MRGFLSLQSPVRVPAPTSLLKAFVSSESGGGAPPGTEAITYQNIQVTYNNLLVTRPTGGYGTS